MTITENFQDYREILPELPLQLPVTFNEGDTVFRTDLTIYWCEAINETLCFVEQVSIEIPVIVSSDASVAELVLPYALVPPSASSDFES